MKPVSSFAPERATEFEGSPVEFVLVGPHGTGRAVVAQSSPAHLDLIGYAAMGDIRSYSILHKASLNLSLNSQENLDVLSVRTYPLDNQLSGEDRRRSFYSFVWRGKARLQQIRQIQEELSLRAAGLRSTLENNDYEELRWMLAPIVSLCDLATRKRVRLQRTLIACAGLLGAVSFFIAWSIFS
jgi:hypothetical protein